MWCVPEITPEFVERMEDVLNVYEKELDPKEPVVCLDERPVQLTEDSRVSAVPSSQPGKVAQQDYEYVRKGTANIFCCVEPKAGRYQLRVTPDRTAPQTAQTFARIERAYSEATTIHLVMDNLNTHSRKCLVESFGEREADRIWSRFTVHYTPKHASWLNQAEIALSLISRQAIGKDRIGCRKLLRRRVTAWGRGANRRRQRIQWQFTTRAARRKFGYRKRDFSRSEY